MNIRPIPLLPPPLLGQHPLFMEAEHRTEDVCMCVFVFVHLYVPLKKKYRPQGCQLTREPNRLNDRGGLQLHVHAHVHLHGNPTCMETSSPRANGNYVTMYNG